MPRFRTVTATFKVKTDDYTDAESRVKYALDHSPLIGPDNLIVEVKIK